MLKLLKKLNKNRRIAKRFVNLLTISIANGEDQRDIMSHVRHQIHLSKFSGNKISDSDLHALREHWIKALNTCYRIMSDPNKALSSYEMNVLYKSETDFVKVLARNNNIEALTEKLELFIDKERYEVAALIRDMLHEYEKTEK